MATDNQEARSAATRYDGLLTDEVLSHALNELGAIHHEMMASGDEYGTVHP